MRTIFLRETTAGGWFLRVMATGEQEGADLPFTTLYKAQRAFILEGRHQPLASMVVMVSGRKPCVIRAGRKLPELDADDEAALLAKIREATRRER